MNQLKKPIPPFADSTKRIITVLTDVMAPNHWTNDVWAALMLSAMINRGHRPTEALRVFPVVSFRC
jgi:hypothetical protein